MEGKKWVKTKMKAGPALLTFLGPPCPPERRRKSVLPHKFAFLILWALSEYALPLPHCPSICDQRGSWLVREESINGLLSFKVLLPFSLYLPISNVIFRLYDILYPTHALLVSHYSSLAVTWSHESHLSLLSSLSPVVSPFPSLTTRNELRKLVNF